MMSHELRTPMTAVIGIAELLQQEPLTASQSQKVGRIATAGKNLLALLNDLLDFAQLQAEQMTVDCIAFSLGDLLEDVRGLFTPLAAEKGLSIRVENAVTAGAVFGDPACLRQILQNLVGNAIKFTDTGGVSIVARQTQATAGHLTLTIEVRDSGIGINPADLVRLFRPFVQSENFKARRRDGTGLGLAISRRIAGLMKGELTVTSELGRGSIFRLTLPVAIPSQETVSQRPLAEVLGPARGSLRILLAEDNDAIRELMREMTAKRTHTVDTVGNGLEALKAVQAGAYDVVIMDMHMPVMDGCEATRLIRSLDGPRCKIPIVALTAGLTESQRAIYVAAGVDQIVAKPAHWPTLFEAIETRGLKFHAEANLTPPPPIRGMTPPDAITLDEAALSVLERAVGEAALTLLLTSFRDGVTGDEQRLRAALETDDLAAAKRVGHGMKGTCLQFSATELGGIGAAIEKAGALSDVRTFIQKIAPALVRLDAALGARAARAKRALV